MSWDSRNNLLVALTVTLWGGAYFKQFTSSRGDARRYEQLKHEKIISRLVVPGKVTPQANKNAR